MDIDVMKTESYYTGPSTLTVDKPATNEPKAAEDPVTMLKQLAYYDHVRKCAALRKERLEDLMQRRTAKKWDAAKKTKMVRRLVTANRELEQSDEALDQLKFRLEQVTVGPVQVSDVSPFVPEPPTSV
jgi:hypothetical protein